MNALAAVARQVWTLFVEDGALAAGLLAWCALCAVASKAAFMPADVAAPVLTLGCVTVLVGSVVSGARRTR